VSGQAPCGGLTTPRLLLRGWRPEDREPFAALNASPEVMEHFPNTLTRERSAELVDHFQAGIDERGWGAWAVERKEDGAFIGFIGLVPVNFDADFTPATEVGWRLDKPYWGNGYATEGARASLEYAFGTLGLDRVVSFTALTNHRSEAVMVRIGMTRMGEFDHPRLPEGHRLRRHVIYEVRPPAA
jgi:RimJ/RimL family protein N-acetyltransferase